MIPCSYYELCYKVSYDANRQKFEISISHQFYIYYQVYMSNSDAYFTYDTKLVTYLTMLQIWKVDSNSVEVLEKVQPDLNDINSISIAKISIEEAGPKITTISTLKYAEYFDDWYLEFEKPVWKYNNKNRCTHKDLICYVLAI